MLYLLDVLENFLWTPFVLKFGLKETKNLLLVEQAVVYAEFKECQPYGLGFGRRQTGL